MPLPHNRKATSHREALTDLVRLLPDDTVTLVHEEGDGMLSVTSGSHTSRLNVYSAEDPRMDRAQELVDYRATVN